jgi:hypothetical protein
MAEKVEESRRVAEAAEDAEVEGELGVHGVLACAIDLFLLQQRSRRKSGWKR